MIAIIVTALQILLLLLRAHFSKENESGEEKRLLDEAQAKLSKVAESFEQKMRYSKNSAKGIDSVQDHLDRERIRK